MQITEALLSINKYSRPGVMNLGRIQGIVLHWTGPAGHTARQVRRYFEVDCPALEHYSSAHYVIDFSGEILRLIPDWEKAYHCGTSTPDPASGRIYTDWARNAFGRYAEYPEALSPNGCTIGIELCAVGERGEFRDATISSAIELTAALCRDHGIPLERVGTHHMVVGWKDCPRLWTRTPALFDAFLADVRRAI